MNDSPLLKPSPIASQEPSETTIKFMLLELQSQIGRWHHADNIAEDRFKTFLTIASGASGVLLLTSQLKMPTDSFLKVGGIIFVLLWLLGLITFLRMLERNRVVVSCMRSVNRARRYFFDLDPKIEPYLHSIPTDSRPNFLSMGGRNFGGRTIVAFIGSLFFGLLCGDLFSIASMNQAVSKSSVLIGITGFVLHLLSSEFYAARKLRRFEEEYDVHFPEIPEQK